MLRSFREDISIFLIMHIKEIDVPLWVVYMIWRECIKLYLSRY